MRRIQLVFRDSVDKLHHACSASLRRYTLPALAVPYLTFALHIQQRSATSFASSPFLHQQHREEHHPVDSSNAHGFHGEGSIATSLPASAAASSSVAILYTPGSGITGSGAAGALIAPTTSITNHCNILAESVSKADELMQQKKAQEALQAGAGILTSEAIDEMLEELREVTTSEVEILLQEVRTTPVVQQAGMHELRRTLFYATTLKEREWIDFQSYTTIMRMLTVEFLRRDNNGVLAPDDVLYISTHMVTANFYNRHLWNRLERVLTIFSNYEHIELTTIKALTTKLFKTRRGCSKETLDMRRKVLAAMTRRIGLLANDFDLPSLLGILQCFSVHDMAPIPIEALAVRATNHLNDFTPQECATLVHVLRKFRLLRLETCERLVEKICSSDKLTHHMANSALMAIRICYNRISDSGRNALHAEPTRQKLRAMGEQVVCRLEEVEFPALVVILNVLDIIVNLRIYIPKKPLQSAFTQAEAMLHVVLEQQDDLIDPKTGKRVRPITAEEGRQLQALLLHYGSDLSPKLSSRLKTAFQEGLLPDEASL
ncbi:unnamed protein product [Phytomonas sp. EM1]|nr:unnamed protein product [Phytomonas sp. EM1]|eukprot:CCW65153.1 unnamed protein product [Phytomonas sp. isolate EM1]